MAMILSPKWLSSIIGKTFNLTKVADQLSGLGLETELVDAPTGAIDKVLTGLVVSTKQHPDADRLKVCQVDVNQAELLTIVCGCPTVTANMVVAVATDGATLPNMQIKASKLRGVDSDGMLCTALELGMSSEKGPLLSLPKKTPLGVPIQTVLALDEKWMQVEITPNRGDCISALGVAREMSIALDSQLETALKPININDNKSLAHIDSACLSYAYAILELKSLDPIYAPHIDYQLHTSGFNRVNSIVDILNYVMLYLGQPMHAFDYDTLSGQISVRFATSGESIQLLDGQTITLCDEDLVIADNSGPIALAGIMGGEQSKVTSETSKLFVESACFDPVVIAKTAKRLGLNTDASYRYIRGCDPELAEKAMSEAISLLSHAYKLKTHQQGLTSNVKERALIRIGLNDIYDYLGLTIDIETLVAYMQAIGCEITLKELDYITIKPASYRNDLCHYYDLIEEVARLYGYERLPKSDLTYLPLGTEDTVLTRQHQLIDTLVSRGYQELYSLSMQSESYASLFVEPDQLIAMDNPLSEEYAVMRPCLLSSLLQQIEQCLNHFVKSAKLVEVGSCFQKPNLESTMISLAMFGSIDGTDKNEGSLAAIKQDVLAVFHRLMPNGQVRFMPSQSEIPMGWHPNQTAMVYLDDKLFGYVGAIHPRLQQNISVPVYAAELSLGDLYRSTKSFEKPKKQSKYPPSTRDLSFWVNTDDAAGILRMKLSGLSELITDVVVLDEYLSKEDSKRSLSFRLIFQSFDKTLKDKEIDKIIDNAVALFGEHGITLRDH